MEPPTGIMPEELVDAERHVDAVNWLLAQPWPGSHKIGMYKGWAVTVGVRTLSKNMGALVRSGTDYGT